MRFQKILHNYVHRNTVHKQEATTFLVTAHRTLTSLSSPNDSTASCGINSTLLAAPAACSIMI